jgi:probable phosphoglycerate mutase
MTEFIVIRHGETVWNAEGRIQGHLDSPLNDEGLAQAELLATRLAGEPFDALYCSDLLRTQQTAEPLTLRTGVRPVLREELRERGLGVFQGLTGPECDAQFPEDYRRFRTRDPEHVVPEGESIRQVYERIRAIFLELADRHAGQIVVVITHGGVLDVLNRFARGIALDHARDFKVYNASVNRIRRDNGGAWSVVQWGDISHLTRDAALDDF